MVLVMSMLESALPAILSFPFERPVFLREYSTNHYSVVSYFLSKLTVEGAISALQVLLQVLISYFLIDLKANFGMLYLAVYLMSMTSCAMAVMVGCAVEDPKRAFEVIPVLFVPQLLFAGFFVVPDLIPIWLRWAQYVFSLTFSLRIMLVEEFGDGCGSEEADTACNALISSVGAEEDELWWNWIGFGSRHANYVMHHKKELAGIIEGTTGLSQAAKCALKSQAVHD
eukprot:scaffold22559_cov111-Cylindrotheca_fusiformis.AAC.11